MTGVLSLAQGQDKETKKDSIAKLSYKRSFYGSQLRDKYIYTLIISLIFY